MLQLNGLTKRFGGFTAVSGVSFELEEGEILGLIGPNGSGKSTTFNLIAGMHAPTAGSIRFQGNEIGGRWPGGCMRRGRSRLSSASRAAGWCRPPFATWG